MRLLLLLAGLGLFGYIDTTPPATRPAPAKRPVTIPAKYPGTRDVPPPPKGFRVPPPSIPCKGLPMPKDFKHPPPPPVPPPPGEIPPLPVLP
jgi:hypothetical protein